jgi:polar amino acid transport system substrate-binding protein
MGAVDGGGTGRTRSATRLAGAALVAVLATALSLTGCSSGYPADPQQTFDDVSGGTLSVGVVHHPPYVDASGAEPTGTEVDLIEDFARLVGAEIEWTVSGEEALMTALEARDLDLVAGGLTDQSPWTTHASLTRSYAQDSGPDGKTAKLVMAVPLGENQMLGELERFLDEHHPGATP